MKFLTRSRPARCHPDRPEFARRLCHDCYNKVWGPDDPRAPKCALHPDRPSRTRGLCPECIHQEWSC